MALVNATQLWRQTWQQALETEALVQGAGNSQPRRQASSLRAPPSASAGERARARPPRPRPRRPPPAAAPGGLAGVLATATLTCAGVNSRGSMRGLAASWNACARSCSCSACVACARRAPPGSAQADDSRYVGDMVLCGIWCWQRWSEHLLPGHGRCVQLCRCALPSRPQQCLRPLLPTAGACALPLTNVS
jgi:hypothetical protein